MDNLAQQATDRNATGHYDQDEEIVARGSTLEKNIAGNAAQQQNVSADSDATEQEPGWVLSSGDLQKEQKPVPQPEKDLRSQWDFRIGKNGVIEHFRIEDGRVAVRETGDKIHILDQDHDSMALALERALERFMVRSNRKLPLLNTQPNLRQKGNRESKGTRWLVATA
jgi:hypothetical protein